MAVRVETIPVLEGNPHALGRHVEHDDRSREHPYTRTVSVPRTVYWKHHGTVLNQRKVGGCTGWSLEQCLATEPLWRPGFTPTNRQALQLYELATRLDSVPGQYLPDDTGSSGLAAAKAAQQILVAGRPLIGSYQHAFGIDHAKATIQTTPFTVGTVWLEGMFHPDVDGTVHPTGQVAGGHQYEVFGHDVDDDMWAMLQSWGPWGVAMKGYATTGVFRMAGRDLAGLLDRQGDITVPVR